MGGSARDEQLPSVAEEGSLPERAAFLLSPRAVVFSLLCSLPWPQIGLRLIEAPLGMEPAGGKYRPVQP